MDVPPICNVLSCAYGPIICSEVVYAALLMSPLSPLTYLSLTILSRWRFSLYVKLIRRRNDNNCYRNQEIIDNTWFMIFRWSKKIFTISNSQLLNRLLKQIVFKLCIGCSKGWQGYHEQLTIQNCLFLCSSINDSNLCPVHSVFIRYFVFV